MSKPLLTADRDAVRRYWQLTTYLGRFAEMNAAFVVARDAYNQTVIDNRNSERALLEAKGAADHLRQLARDADLGLPKLATQFPTLFENRDGTILIRPTDVKSGVALPQSAEAEVDFPLN